MGKATQPKPVKLICGMISPKETLCREAGNSLEEEFGEIDFESHILPFVHTKYYQKELGTALERKFISFKNLIDPGGLAEVKLFTNKLEKEKFSRWEKREINLDPGYICISKLVLATTKNHQHRIYLKDGIYAEVTLRFVGRTFVPYEWTYPDYRTEEYIKIFNSIRHLYLAQIEPE